MLKKEVVIFNTPNGKQPFIEWIEALDKVTRGRIEARLLRVSLGNYGDYKILQKGVSELRFKFGAGYRVYFGEDGGRVVLLLTGGDKKTQKRDIIMAIKYWELYKADKQ